MALAPRKLRSKDKVITDRKSLAAILASTLGMTSSPCRRARRGGTSAMARHCGGFGGQVHAGRALPRFCPDRGAYSLHGVVRPNWP